MHRLHSTKNFENFETGTNGSKKKQGPLLPKNVETVEFQKNEPCNREFWKFHEESQTTVIPENFCVPRKVSELFSPIKLTLSFPEFPENAVAFATGNSNRSF